MLVERLTPAEPDEGGSNNIDGPTAPEAGSCVMLKKVCHIATVNVYAGVTMLPTLLAKLKDVAVKESGPRIVKLGWP
jgi:hypothetical protein